MLSLKPSGKAQELLGKRVLQSQPRAAQVHRLLLPNWVLSFPGLLSKTPLAMVPLLDNKVLLELVIYIADPHSFSGQEQVSLLVFVTNCSYWICWLLAVPAKPSLTGFGVVGSCSLYSRRDARVAMPAARCSPPARWLQLCSLSALLCQTLALRSPRSIFSLCGKNLMPHDTHLQPLSELGLL